MSKLCVYFLIAPSCVLIQPAIMWKTHTPTVLVDAGIVLSKRALPDKYRQLNPSSCSHLYPLSPMISVCSSSPHLSLAIPTYASLSVGWSPTHQVPCMSFHDCDFDNSRVCPADVAISNAATLVRSSASAQNRTCAFPHTASDMAEPADRYLTQGRKPEDLFSECHQFGCRKITKRA
jgi:hypothetical protein